MNRSPTTTPAPTEVTGVRSVLLLMTDARAAAFGRRVRVLRDYWGTGSIVEMVDRALAECEGLVTLSGVHQ